LALLVTALWKERYLLLSQRPAKEYLDGGTLEPTADAGSLLLLLLLPVDCCRND
jgi:hypothetical protein